MLKLYQKFKKKKMMMMMMIIPQKRIIIHLHNPLNHSVNLFIPFQRVTLKIYDLK